MLRRRTFPTVTFPATLILKREEVETEKAKGASIIAAVHHGYGTRQRVYVQAPFDLMYGFRGEKRNVDLLCAYEMLLHWSMERIPLPGKDSEHPRSVWTGVGLQAKEAAKASGRTRGYVPGEHYAALDAPHRILLPDTDALGGLCHCWCWGGESTCPPADMVVSQGPTCGVFPRRECPAKVGVLSAMGP